MPSVMPPVLPRHVAIIMDGNGRWAKKRGLARIEGHRKGAESVKDVVRAARQIGLECLTLYAFSQQNWSRPPDEVKALMELLRDYLLEERQEIMENDIRLRAIGQIERMPRLVLDPLDALVEDSKDNKTMTLCLALSYGGREAIVDACKRALAAGVTPDKLDETALTAHMPTRDFPPLDLLIRTSGEQRISNFLLWESAYTELYFTDTLWPDFRRGDLYAALDAFAGRERRFGLTSDQIQKANP